MFGESNAWIEAAIMADLEHLSGLTQEFPELFALFNGNSEWLFDQNMFSGGENQTAKRHLELNDRRQNDRFDT